MNKKFRGKASAMPRNRRDERNVNQLLRRAVTSVVAKIEQDGPAASAAIKPYRVLSLDGGGIRGIYTAAFLDRLVVQFARTRGEECLDLGKGFDLITGTSTGAIVANHSDVGGSYPETESRLSDIALAWMCEEATKVPDGLKTGPILVSGVKMDNTGDVGPILNIFPAADGVQHCEIAGMRDALDAFAEKLPNWKWLQNQISKRNWEVQIRTIDPDAPVHPTVSARFDRESVVQCARTVAPYRPEALRNHHKFEQYYKPS